MALRGSSLDEAFKLLGVDTPGGPAGQGSFEQPPLNAPSKIDGFNSSSVPLATGANARPMPVESTNTPILLAPRIEDSVEYQTMQSHLKTSISRPPQLSGGTPAIRNMQTCEDFQVHLRNCPECREYMKKLLSMDAKDAKDVKDAKEDFANIDAGVNNQLIDVAILVGIGFFIILVLDCLARMMK